MISQINEFHQIKVEKLQELKKICAFQIQTEKNN